MILSFNKNIIILDSKYTAQICSIIIRSSTRFSGSAYIFVFTNLPLTPNEYKFYYILEQEVDKAVDDYKIDRAIF